jgi:hypothetical protein
MGYGFGEFTMVLGIQLDIDAACKYFEKNEKRKYNEHNDDLRYYLEDKIKSYGLSIVFSAQHVIDDEPYAVIGTEILDTCCGKNFDISVMPTEKDVKQLEKKLKKYRIIEAEDDADIEFWIMRQDCHCCT